MFLFSVDMFQFVVLGIQVVELIGELCGEPVLVSICQITMRPKLQRSLQEKRVSLHHLAEPRRMSIDHITRSIDRASKFVGQMECLETGIPPCSPQ